MLIQRVARPPSCLHATACTAELPLLAVDRGEPRLVGRLLRGALVRVGVSEGDRTPVHVCDPDVECVGTYIGSSTLRSKG